VNQLAAVTKRRSLWWVAAVAFAAMCCQDLIATIEVVAEAHYNAPVAGMCDVMQWVAGLICSALAIEEIIKNGWRTRRSLTIIGAVSCANFAGTFAGVALAHVIERGGL
jgi:hypothetical protein